MNTLNRREFLQRVASGVMAMGIGRLPTITRDRDSGTEQPASLESENFVWPEEIKGNEAWFGADILITIDDCYDLESTREMVTQMLTNNVRATFFPNTKYLDPEKKGVKELWKVIWENGFDIGYHTVNHESGLSESKLEADLLEFKRQMQKLLDDPAFEVQFVRPPEGNWNREWMSWTRNNGLTTVKWNFVPNATNGGVDYFKAVMNNPEGGRIVLLHPREFDTTWLSGHITELIQTAGENGGKCVALTESARRNSS